MRAVMKNDMGRFAYTNYGWYPVTHRQYVRLKVGGWLRELSILGRGW